MQRLRVRLARGSFDTFGTDDISCAAATSLGFFDEQGLDISWLDRRGGVASMQAALDGDVDVAYAGFGPVMSLRADGHPCRIIVSQARALAQTLVVQKRITEPSQLAGVSWAVDGIGAMSHHMGRLLVGALGIDENGIGWDPVGPPPLRIESLLSGRMDASLIRTEEAIGLNRDHGDTVHRLMDFDEIKALVPNQPHGVLACTEQYERENPEALERVAKAMILASRELHDNPDAFRTLIRQESAIRLSDDEIQLIWQREHDNGGWAVNGEMTREHWQEELDIYLRLNPTMRRISLEELLAPGFVKQALTDVGLHPADFDRGAAGW